jgi:hypothetical protein
MPATEMTYFYGDVTAMESELAVEGVAYLNLFTSVGRRRPVGGAGR